MGILWLKLAMHLNFSVVTTISISLTIRWYLQPKGAYLYQICYKQVLTSPSATAASIASFFQDAGFNAGETHRRENLWLNITVEGGADINLFLFAFCFKGWVRACIFHTSLLAPLWLCAVVPIPDFTRRLEEWQVLTRLPNTELISYLKNNNWRNNQ